MGAADGGGLQVPGSMGFGVRSLDHRWPTVLSQRINQQAHDFSDIEVLTHRDAVYHLDR